VRAAFALALALASCVADNRALLAELEASARAAPRPELDAVTGDVAKAVDGIGRPHPATLRMLPGELPAVSGLVNGRPLPLLLDTGATLVTLSAHGAQEVGLYLPPGAAARVAAPGNRTRHRIGAFETLELGGLRFGPGAATIPESAAYRFRPAGGGSRAYGIVGLTVLGRFRLRFDFARREVRLDPSPGVGAAGSLWVPVEVSGRRYWLLVDSGAERVVLEPWVALELGLIEAREAKELSQPGEGFGRARRNGVRLPGLRVASRDFGPCRVWIVHTFGEDYPKGDFRPGGLLGLAGFGKLVWTVDFAARRLRVEDP